ncbi:GntR family transcriptional repressor for pyruvate dehydrogenase complex [Agrobacterium larrymoorei]|uniref:GntR family transcriptional repressor for pyruvate dehydrogenase complex n=2 Tax=Agrobacterium larrymoorei TaxID=160699 RepID=A0ABU0UHJ7_9HYPH|nr:GntR family transcriptional repressor for pyruvate dehydrogenase complex [Agrobacterium larrymoorei]
MDQTLEKHVMSPLPVIDRVRQVEAALVEFVERADLKPGSRLPAERELMSALGVGRSTIREVIRKFQALGIIDSRKGSGNYLLKPISTATVHMPISIEAQSLRDALLMTLEVRRGIEVEASMAAARRRTDADIETMRLRLEEMERVHLAEGTSGKADLAFHLSIYDATHNSLFKQLLEQMREGFERFWSKPFDRPDFASRSFPFHRTLFNAIVAGDTSAAQQETLKILAIVEEDIKDMSK